MAYRANPYLERMSERTSDQEFVRLFSPRIIERLPDDVFEGAVHIFRSPPGGGKTTLLRAFTPTALKAFWNARTVDEIDESYQRLLARGIFDSQTGPQLLGVFVSCASGYADLPPGAAAAQDGQFRALLNCRIVLRALRSVSLLVNSQPEQQLDHIALQYDESARDLQAVPALGNAAELVRWAEQREREVYAQLDAVTAPQQDTLHDLRLDGLLWLQSVRFFYEGKEFAPKRLLMVDDLHRLRKSQRSLLISEATELRPAIPVWLAERSIALGDELLSQGAREGRDLREYPMDELWSSSKGGNQTINTFSQILDRRLHIQNIIPPGTFSQYLNDQLVLSDVEKHLQAAIEHFEKVNGRLGTNMRYQSWLQRGRELVAQPSSDTISGLLSILIIISRDEARRQLALQLEPLPSEELDQRDSSQVKAAAEIMANDEFGAPYYFGVDRICAMATNNVEELLSLAAVLYDGLRAKLVLRRAELILSAFEQEKLLKAAAKRKRDFIPKAHTEGTRASSLLDAIGSFCREKTFQTTAPYAPGVTGVRLSQSELAKIRPSQGSLPEQMAKLRRVISESVAENLLTTRDSSASTSRESGTVFYLNRTLCVHYGLPLQYGGWQDITVQQAVDWMENSRVGTKKAKLELGS
ncbi:MAG TPA: hypothetical protein VGF56_11170 [Rhizomicrobium sp.]|jgi:hypothetical protein